MVVALAGQKATHSVGPWDPWMGALMAVHSVVSKGARRVARKDHWMVGAREASWGLPRAAKMATRWVPSAAAGMVPPWVGLTAA